MKTLNYQVLKESGYTGYVLEEGPEKVLQFGEGNFLRAFADCWFDLANERVGWNGKCVLVQPIPQGLAKEINAQQGLYTLCLRGRENGQPVDRRRVISVVSRCLNPYEGEDYQAMLEVAVSPELEYIVSNTTEAGIVYDPTCKLEDQPPASFPAKLTQVLYRRWQAGQPGLVILSCELIDSNGTILQDCVERHAAQWGLEAAFLEWLKGCTFCSTLVDRIVPGRIRDREEQAELEGELGYADPLLDVGEVFGVWVIQGPEWLEDKLPFRAAGLNCPVVPDVTPYKHRKVRILNGGHTGFVPGAYLAGFDIVRGCMAHPVVRGFLEQMLYREIIPTLELDRADLEQFAQAVEDRFDNPFVDHALLSICLNTVSKWRARNLPSLLAYQRQTGQLPPCLTMSLAAAIQFYCGHMEELTGQGLVCRRSDGTAYTVFDDRWVLEFCWAHRGDNAGELVRAILSHEQMWGMDLTSVDGLTAAVTADLDKIRADGVLAAYAACLEENA